MGLPLTPGILHPSCSSIPGFTDRAERLGWLVQWQETGTRMCTVVADAQRKGTRGKVSRTGCAIDRQVKGISDHFSKAELTIVQGQHTQFLTFVLCFYLLIKCTLPTYHLHDLEALIVCVSAHVWSMCTEVHVSFCTYEGNLRYHCSGILPTVF